jgi:hypothetical protein
MLEGRASVHAGTLGLMISNFVVINTISGDDYSVVPAFTVISHSTCRSAVRGRRRGFSNVQASVRSPFAILCPGEVALVLCEARWRLTSLTRLPPTLR